ncbi:hypothetical protein [Clostridium sp. CH2]|uniref:hypothetical protein n=1 Tax=Clostridium sp. CH2 TaxID=2949990 RepID=UPI00207A1932|nr:hypothetical protein [Clostridium sp. CH2]
MKVYGKTNSSLRSSSQGYHAVCPECNWEGSCWINIETGTAKKNAQQEADTHNKNTIHDSGEKPAKVEICYGGLE